MSKAFFLLLASLVTLAPFRSVGAEGQTLLQWTGRAPITDLAHRDALPEQVFPEVVKSTLGGGGRDLLFKVEEGAKAARGRQFIDLLLPVGASLPQATLSCYLYPERGRLSEDLLSALPAGAVEGFRLRHSWGILFFEAGDGHEKAQVKVDHRNQRGALLDFKSWQHLAVVFDEGAVRIYKNGRLILSEETGLAALALGRTPLRLGAYPGRAPASYPFHGRMTGITLLDTALDRDGIFQLMERTLR